MKSLGKSIVFFIIFGGILFAVDRLACPDTHATLLVNLVFWVPLFQGCLALVAAAEIAQAKWILPLKPYLFSMVSMIFLSTIVFLFLIPQWGIYPAHGEDQVWFSQSFFFLRNFAALLLSAFLGLKYVRSSMQELPNKSTYAVLYIMSFVLAQSLLAYDWIMPLEYPWTSTILGPYCFVESIYLGLAASAFIAFRLYRKEKGKPSDKIQKAQYDTGLMMFGFSVLWMGFFFFQAIVIWYGNLPEEVSFYTRRLASPILATFGYIVIVALFFIPFLVLLNKRVRGNPYLTTCIATLIFAGIFIERFLMITPVAPVYYPALAAEFILFGILALGTAKIVGFD